MSVLDIRFDVDPVGIVLDEFVARGGDLQPAMEIVALDLVAAVEDMYATSGQGAWSALAASTLDGRRGSGGKPLVDTGVLAGSTAPHADRFSAEASTDVPYVVFHLEGGGIIPQRNPFELADDVFDRAELTILEYILGK